MNVALILGFIRNAHVVYDVMSSEELKTGHYDDLVFSLTSKEIRTANPIVGFKFMKRSGTTVTFSTRKDLDDPFAERVKLDLSVNGLNDRSEVTHSFYQAIAWMILASRVSIGLNDHGAYSHWSNQFETLNNLDIEDYFDSISPQSMFVPDKGSVFRFTPTWTVWKVREGFEFMMVDLFCNPIRLTMNGSFLLRCAESVEALALELEDCVLRRGIDVVPGSHGPVSLRPQKEPLSSFVIQRVME